uniref:MHC class II alpha chain N-terminal domain-containing protein n=1 Tax=Terrapene triunguis TaxID=2587831 RepID=A0A674K477_9SAUR
MSLAGEFPGLPVTGVGADACLPAVEHVISQAEFYQHKDRSQQVSGEFMFELDQDEIFYVDLERKETVWRLPDFGKFTSFEEQGALGSAAVGKANLESLIRSFNHTRAQNEPPEVTVFPEDPVTKGISETDFYPRQDNSFRKFSYLPFLPSQGDFYDCRVGTAPLTPCPVPLPLSPEAQVPNPIPETTETLVCALGLAVGIIGIIAGTILIIKGMKMNAARNPRGPL